MEEPEKPFACSDPECRMTFTNEDHLHVHIKKHDMVLQLGSEQKAAFVADQTPTPTRFIRNCEEVGLFQDLNVNPFDEGFKRAMESKHGILSLETLGASDDLHTPQMAFPLIDSDSTLYSATNNQRNITISRSSSDESGSIKEYETTTISKLTNEITTISRVVEKHDSTDKTSNNNDISIVHKELVVNKDKVNEKSISYTNNVIKIHSDLGIRKDTNINEQKPIKSYIDTVIRNGKDILNDNINIENKIPPIISQKSLENVVDNFTADNSRDSEKIKPTLKRPKNVVNKKNKKTKGVTTDLNQFEVIIKLPNGEQVKMKAVDDKKKESPNEEDCKEKLKRILNDKIEKTPLVTNINVAPQKRIAPLVPVGTLIPVTLVAPVNNMRKVPIPAVTFKKPAVRIPKPKPKSDDKVLDKRKQELESRSEACRRYRQRFKERMNETQLENLKLREVNERLISEKAVLKQVLMEHLKTCPMANDLRSIYEKLAL